METSDVLNKTPQLQPSSKLPSATRRSEVGLALHCPWYLEVRWQRGAPMEPGLGPREVPSGSGGRDKCEGLG